VLPHGHALGERTVIDWTDLHSERFIFRQAKCDPVLCERISSVLPNNPAAPSSKSSMSAARRSCISSVWDKA
jgi:hypothetical protein